MIQILRFAVHAAMLLPARVQIVQRADQKLLIADVEIS